MPLHVSSTVALIIRRSKLYYTASGIITPIGDRPVHKFCASSWLITKINILRCTVSKTSKFVMQNKQSKYTNASSLNLCTLRPPTGVMIPEAV